MAKLYWRVKKQGKWTWKAANYDAVTGLVTQIDEACDLYVQKEES